ncbi:MAG: hypothetical protein P8R54_32645 [Myxococcota bacterium]|nr:hypothetical protein [Myxococcota bacterium]
MKRTIVLAATLLSLSAPAFAQSDEVAEQEIVYQDVTEHIFDGTNVDGAIVVPELVLRQERQPMKIGSFINLRMDFNTEMSSSTNEIR